MALHLIDHQDEDVLFFDPEVSHHIVRSLRKQPGETIHATDGHGTIFTALIRSIDHRQVSAIINNQEFHIKNWNVHIACSLIKKDSRFEYFLEKATELGVHRITPLKCQRTLKPGLRTDRAQKIIESAVQQSFNPYVPILESVQNLENFLTEDRSGTDQKFIATAVERVELPLLEQQYSGQNPVTILIGPEGDFTPAETELALSAGWHPVSLGQNRLRTETAAIAAVQIIKSCYHIKTLATQ